MTDLVEYNANNEDVAFEPTDWRLATIGWVYALSIVLLAVSSILMMLVFPSSLPDANRSLTTLPPRPRLQVNPSAALNKFRAHEANALDTYYWVDKQKGIVHIPIEQAIKKLVATGIQGFPKGQP